MKSGLKEETHTINDQEVTFYSYKLEQNDLYLPTRGRIIPRCTWSKEYEPGIFKCRIHPVVSLTCDMPHLRFSYVSRSGTVSLGIQQFGRNWALKCPVRFKEPSSESEFNEARESRLRKLNRLDKLVHEFGSETWIPEMIEYINKIPYSNYSEFLGKDCVSLHTKFFGRSI